MIVFIIYITASYLFNEKTFQIYRKDPLSKVICEKCLDNVKHIHAFRKSTLGTVDQQIKRLKTKETRDVLLYLDTFNNADEVSELLH